MVGGVWVVGSPCGPLGPGPTARQEELSLDAGLARGLQGPLPASPRCFPAPAPPLPRILGVLLLLSLPRSHRASGTVTLPSTPSGISRPSLLRAGGQQMEQGLPAEDLVCSWQLCDPEPGTAPL